MPGSLLRRFTAATAVAASATLGLLVAGAAPASAAGSGYVRLAHLSPDTPSVDVYLAAQSGGKPQVFPGVGYGAMSDYLRLPVGSYAVSMRKAGAAANTPAVLTTQVTVAAGKAYTVAGVGRYADLGLRVLQDDLSLPTDNKAKIRIIQASVQAPVLDVALTTGSSIAKSVEFATTTSYRQVNPGRWTVEVQPASGGSSTELGVTCRSGSVYSLLVLDAGGGRLKAELRLDAKRGGVPQGGVATGAGGTWRPESDPGGASPALIGAALAALLVPAGVVLLRRRLATTNGRLATTNAPLATANARSATTNSLATANARSYPADGQPAPATGRRPATTQ